MRTVLSLSFFILLFLNTISINAQFTYQTRVITSEDLNPSLHTSQKLTNNYIGIEPQEEYYIIFSDNRFFPNLLLEPEPLESEDYVIVPRIVISPDWDMLLRDITLGAIPDKIYNHNRN